MASPYNANGKNGISVADAKAYIATIKTDAIANQIAHYKQVATSLNTLAQSVTTINSNLQETWSGIAADAANKKFGTVAGQASNMALILSETVVPTLSAVHTGALSAQAQIRGVQDEVTQVHNPIMGFAQANTGIVGSTPIAPVVSSKASTPPVVSNSTLTPAEAVAFNAKQRAVAACAMNTVATSYSSSTSTFTYVAGQLSQDTSTLSPSRNATGFALTVPEGGSGSTGAADRYQSNIGTEGSSISSIGSLSGKTRVQDFVPLSPMAVSPSPSSAGAPLTLLPAVLSPTTPTASPPFEAGEPVDDPPIATAPVNGIPTIGEPVKIDPVTGLPSGGMPGMGAGSGPSSLGLFGEGGLPGSAGGTRIGAPATAEGAAKRITGDTPVDGGAGRSALQPNAGMMGGGMRGVEGVGAERGGKVSSSPSASYLRGRYFGDENGVGQPSVPWESPAIGGSESVLIGAQLDGGAGVTSIYAEALDSQGNPVSMMGSGGFGGSRSFGDEKENSGRRPGYLKEDPQWWSPEGSYVPPVVE